MLLLAAWVTVQAPPRVSMADLQWLVGCWASMVPGDDTREHRIGAGADALLGVSRAVRNGTLRTCELVALRELRPSCSRR